MTSDDIKLKFKLSFLLTQTTTGTPGRTKLKNHQSLLNSKLISIFLFLFLLNQLCGPIGPELLKNCGRCTGPQTDGPG